MAPKPPASRSPTFTSRSPKRPLHPSFEAPQPRSKAAKMEGSGSPPKNEEDENRLEKFPDYIDPSSLSFFDDFESTSVNQPFLEKSSDQDTAAAPYAEASDASSTSSSSVQDEPEASQAQDIPATSPERSTKSRSSNSTSGSPHKTKPLQVIPEYRASRLKDPPNSPIKAKDSMSDRVEGQNEANRGGEPQTAFLTVYQQTPVRAPFSNMSFSSGSSNRSASAGRASSNNSMHGDASEPKCMIPQEAPVMGPGKNFKDPFFYHLFLRFKDDVADLGKGEKRGEGKKKEVEAAATAESSSSSFAAKQTASNEDDEMDIDGEEYSGK